MDTGDFPIERLDGIRAGLALAEGTVWVALALTPQGEGETYAVALTADDADRLARELAGSAAELRAAALDAEASQN